jgi:hypothetical protein
MLVALTPIWCSGTSPSAAVPPPVGRPVEPAATNIPATAIERNSEGLVQASHAGVVYVIGSVGRSGGISIDPEPTPTLLQALALAGGPGRHAALTKAVPIRERESGRTVTTLNLKRILRGEDLDLPIRDRDIDCSEPLVLGALDCRTGPSNTRIVDFPDSRDLPGRKPKGRATDEAALLQ